MVLYFIFIKITSLGPRNIIQAFYLNIIYIFIINLAFDKLLKRSLRSNII